MSKKLSVTIYNVNRSGYAIFSPGNSVTEFDLLSQYEYSMSGQLNTLVLLRIISYKLHYNLLHKD